MRGTFLAVAATFSVGCVTALPPPTVTTIPVQRMAFTSLPTPSSAIQGSGGVSLRASATPGAPEAIRSDGAVSFPLFQPDLGALVKIGRSSYLGGRVAISSPSFGTAVPANLIAPESSAVAFDVSVGGGHDFRFTELLGLSISGEFGLAGTSLTRVSRARTTELHTLPTGRATIGFLITPGKFRFYGGGTVATTVSNSATGLRTEVCQLDCSVSETGSLDLTLMGMIGAGVRWQANDHVSLAFELWEPVSEIQRSWPVMSLTLRVGDFGNSPPPPRPLPPPPPPPSFTPEPEQLPPQL